MSQNPFLLAADNSPSLLPLLRQNSSLASRQDEHGYSLLHAAASYNHVDLLRALVQEFQVDVNLKDEDGETALFFAETQEAARVLVEELGIDFHHKGADGLTALEKISLDGDFPSVSTYLRGLQARTPGEIVAVAPDDRVDASHRLPAGMTVTVGTVNATQDIPSEIDPIFQRRIEELAQREDFNDSSGQADLRKLVEDAISDQQLGEPRNIRSRQA
ncbi:ankyrin repeat-containing protein [Moelleriella libera RCEF 2490]|uniref:Ankyrin repeat-containing protein n=1 Tax=Moelleriella libera RCEF 2490 TaxID=1081109 RepID=A0A168C549_9HYPO|nr:ankyrin repeat-containing protein [Moelleriella libera RCEF 2490]